MKMEMDKMINATVNKTLHDYCMKGYERLGELVESFNFNIDDLIWNNTKPISELLVTPQEEFVSKLSATDVSGEEYLSLRLVLEPCIKNNIYF